MPQILVVCYGNLCRSPMAQGLLQARLGDDWRVTSAGTGAIGGDPPENLASWAVRKLEGIDISSHRSSPLTAQVLMRSDHVLTMSRRQATEAAAFAPEVADRTRLMGAFVPAEDRQKLPSDPWGGRAREDEVGDPMGGTPSVFLAVAERLAAASDAIVVWLQAGGDPAEAPPSIATLTSRRG